VKVEPDVLIGLIGVAERVSVSRFGESLTGFRYNQPDEDIGLHLI
jgi:hypothetical protein